MQTSHRLHHADQPRDLLGGRRSAPVIALDVIATEQTQHVRDLFRLDSLADDFDAEVVRQVDDRTHDEQVVLVDAMCWMKERSILIDEMGSFFSDERDE